MRKNIEGNNFFRTSRTDIINLDKVAMIHKEFQGMYTIEMRGGVKVDLSRRKAGELKKIIDF